MKGNASVDMLEYHNALEYYGPFLDNWNKKKVTALVGFSNCHDGQIVVASHGTACVGHACIHLCSQCNCPMRSAL